MTAIEIIKNVCIYLGKEEILNSSFFETNGGNLTQKEQSDLKKMLECLNFVIEEIASDYLPILKTKQVELNDGSMLLKDIDNNLQEIISIKTLNGKTLRYAISDDKLICLASKVEITYKVYPKEITLLQTVESFGGRLSARVIAYGVASEYCYLEMLYDDASIWESRFKNALLIAQRKKGEIKLKRRGWF